MFSRLRDPGGRYTLLMAGLALLVLAAWASPMLAAGALAVVPLGLGLSGLACLGAWWRQRREARYDLNRLWTDLPPADEEPYEDALPEGEASSPYCGWCDEAYPPGTRRCLRCGREL